MQYFPIFLNLRHRRVLLIGGGEVAMRKAETLTRAEAQLTIIAPQITESLATLPQTELRRRPALLEDIDETWSLVVLATNNSALQARLAERCRALRIPVNRCDAPEDSDFVTGSLIDRPPVLAAITSSGSPTLSRLLRRRLEAAFDAALEPALLDLGRLLNEIRPEVRKRFADSKSREAFFRAWGTEEAVTKLREQGPEAIRKEMLQCLSC
ncbi:MAG: bifunctional precorrin-2 dehydrogenase/sirohydrochlorin ferrochelatase [Candidatus Ozemobacteraceae bacterium]